MAAESIINRKALRDYHIVDRYEAGIELKGSEVKSIRAGKANISDAFARIENGEAQVKGRALVVLKLYWKNGKVKAEVGVGMGKVARDKRADLKKRAIDRETAREVARFNRKHA